MFMKVHGLVTHRSDTRVEADTLILRFKDPNVLYYFTVKKIIYLKTRNGILVFLAKNFT
jgi:hypothetical protein